MSYRIRIASAVPLALILATASRAGIVIHVDAANCPGPGSGTERDPYCSIQTAIDNAVDTDEIIVAPGTYFETINLLGMAITLRSSDGPEVTTIDGTGNFHVVQCVSGEGPDTILKGFTITGGNANGVSSDSSGGGMYMANSSPTVVNCTLIGNSCSFGAGGGMFNFLGSPTVSNCRFSGNSAVGSGAAGGMVNFGGSPTVTNCTFTGNSGPRGGGMANYISSPTVSDCTFEGNSATSNLGGGMYNLSSSPTVTNCTFTGNTAALWGGAVYITGLCSLTVTNCTFAMNSASNGQALFINGSSSEIVMTSCIVWHSGYGIANSTNSAITITYSDVAGGWPGVGNIDADPLFVDPDNGDYRLQTGSPTIDAGHNWAIAGLTDTDLDGNPRFAADKIDFDPGCGIPVVVDMGAYEYQGDPFPVRLGDIDGDGIVGLSDFLALLANWGPCPKDCCLADLDIDGDVGITDFLLLLGNWG